MLAKELQKLIGKIPQDNNPFKQRMRFHQGWWRTFVLAEEPGRNPANHEDTVCNTIANESDLGKNFLTLNIRSAYRNTISIRNETSGRGIINEDRAMNNLLSSQPLCFNYFGELKADLEFARQVLRNWTPSIAKVTAVEFEYAPAKKYTGDNSAFDIAFFYQTVNGKRGVFGLECKYTDDFSFKPKKSQIFYGDKGNKNYDSYLEIYEARKASFSRPYYDFVKNKNFNQLFRNQLIAESLIQNEIADEVITGLFYHHLDKNALEIGSEFQGMLTKGADRFKLISQRDFITGLQMMEISWERREWVMMLWARYCALELSACASNNIFE